MRHCTICVHPQRQQIEEAILAKESERSIAARFGVSPAAVHRHKERHLPAKMLADKDAAYLLDAHQLFTKVEALVTESEDLVRHAKESEKIDSRAWAAGIREARNCLELLTKLSIAQVQEPDAFDTERTLEEQRTHEEAIWRKVEVQRMEEGGHYRIDINRVLDLLNPEERKIVLRAVRRVYSADGNTFEEGSLSLVDALPGEPCRDPMVTEERPGSR